MLKIFVRVSPHDFYTIGVDSYDNCETFTWDGRLCISHENSNSFHIGEAETIEQANAIIETFKEDFSFGTAWDENSFSIFGTTSEENLFTTI